MQVGFSWAFVGAFQFPPKRAAALKKALPPRRTDAAELRESPTNLRDVLYGTAEVSLRHLVDKGEYREHLTHVRSLLQTIAANGGVGEAHLVPFVDGPGTGGVTFILDESGARERALETKKAVQEVCCSPAYRALVEHVNDALEDDAPKAVAGSTSLRKQVLSALAKVPDAELVAAARATKFKVDVYDKKRGVSWAPLIKLYPEAKAMRQALVKGSKEPSENINHAPLALLAHVDPAQGLAVARALADAERLPGFDEPFKEAALRILAGSTVRADLERLWKAFDAQRRIAHAHTAAEEGALVACVHPDTDALVFAALQAELGSKDAWKTWDDRLSGGLARILWRRDHGPAVELLTEAAKSHEWKYFFPGLPDSARGKRAW